VVLLTRRVALATEIIEIMVAIVKTSVDLPTSLEESRIFLKAMIIE
jgi:hypothetical protein